MRQDKFMEVNPLTDPVIVDIAKDVGKSAAQVILRWHVQRGTVPLVKTTKEERLAENMAVHDWTLSDEQMEKIDGLDNDVRLYNPKFMQGFDWNNMPFYE